MAKQAADQRSAWPIKQAVLVASLALIMGSVVLSMLAAGPSRRIGLLASGAAQEDMLPACLAGIPKDASAGQRMIAEQSCTRDETAREPIRAAPGR